MLVGGGQHDRVGTGLLRSSIRVPASSTQMQTASKPARAATSASSGLLGSSSAMRFAPAARERLANQAQPLRVTVRDDHMLGVGHDAAHTTEVVRQRHPQARHTARIAVAELGVGDGRERVAQGAQPRCPREGGHIRHARAKVEPRAVRRRRRRCPSLTGNRRRRRDARTRPLAQAQITLRRQLRIGVHDHPPRNAELSREIACRWDAASGRRAPSRIARRSLSSIWPPRVRGHLG